jgi:hypothetical protein
MKALISDASGGDIRVETSPTHKLHKVRQKIYGKLTLLLPSLKTHADFQKWEPDVGGKFPRELYEDIISRSTRYDRAVLPISQSVPAVARTRFMNDR